MTEHTAGLLDQVEEYVRGLFQKKLSKTRYFHDLEHTHGVVKNCYKLAGLESCSDNDIVILLTAAWFHDIGYIHVSKNHEMESSKIGEEFLRGKSLPNHFISRMQGIILATKVPTRPIDLLEKIICDADLSHLGSTDYFRWELKLKQELEFADKIHIEETLWNTQNVLFFRNHRYYTQSARELWEDQKQRNLVILQNLSDKGI